MLVRVTRHPLSHSPGALPWYRTTLSGVSIRRIDYGCLQSIGGASPKSQHVPRAASKWRLAGVTL